MAAVMVFRPGHPGADGRVNIIPLNLIERVDVLKEGARALSTALTLIAGVVNFITKQDFTGTRHQPAVR